MMLALAAYGVGTGCVRDMRLALVVYVWAESVSMVQLIW